MEGTVFANGSLRLVLIDGVGVESPLEGTLLIIKNNDQPGVIGDVGTLLGRHKVNIANFALGRDPECLVDCAIGVVKVDEHPETGGGRSPIRCSPRFGRFRTFDPSGACGWSRDG